MPRKLKETNTANKHNRLTNPKWREADQLAIYKHDRGVELESSEKQFQLSGRPRAGPLNPRPPDFKSGALTTRPCCLLSLTVFNKIIASSLCFRSFCEEYLDLKVLND